MMKRGIALIVLMVVAAIVFGLVLAGCSDEVPEEEEEINAPWGFGVTNAYNGELRVTFLKDDAAHYYVLFWNDDNIVDSKQFESPIYSAPYVYKPYGFKANTQYYFWLQALGRKAKSERVGPVSLKYDPYYY